MLGGEVPVCDEEVDHAVGGGVGCGEGVGGGFDDEPAGAGVGGGGGFDDGAGEGLGFVEGEAECGVGGALDAIDADLAVALGGVGVAAGEECAGDLYGEVKGGAGGELADVHVAAEGARGAGAVLAGFGGGNAHDAAEGAQRHDGGGERAGGVGVECPGKEEGLVEALFEEAEAGDDAGPAPALVGDAEDVDLEDVTVGGAMDGYGAGEGVDDAAVDGLEVVEGGGGGDLRAAGVEAGEVDGVAGVDGEARRQGGVPAGVRGFGGEGVVHRGSG